jgi:PEP-CTERM motif
MRKTLAFATTLMAVGFSSSAYAIIDLTFDGIAPTYPFSNSDVFIENYYNGGMSSVGTTGPNYGVTFSSNALNICLNSLSVACSNTSKGGLGPANSQEGALFFLSGSDTFMDVAAGFTTGFSFNYVSENDTGSVSVYSGLNGTGTLLATIDLSPNAGSCPGYDAGFCPFSPIGVAFSGIAESVSFAGVENQIVFDDVTFGSATPGATPEPSTWTMMALGFAGLGFASYRKAKSRRMALSVA